MSQNRKPAGTPTGGQFAPGGNRDESASGLNGGAWRIERDRYPNGRLRTIFHYEDGRPQDPEDGAPAWTEFYEDGTLKTEGHFQAGQLHDPAPGHPALVLRHPNGKVAEVRFCQHGQVQDPEDGTPAVQRFRADGRRLSATHYRAGKPYNPLGEPGWREWDERGSEYAGWVEEPSHSR